MKKKILSVLGVLTALGAEAKANDGATVRGQTRHFQIDLGKINSVRTSPDSILAMESVLVDRETSFGKNPYVEGTSLALVGLRVKSRGIQLVSSSLRMNFTANGSLRAEACQAEFSSCHALKLTSIAKNLFIFNIHDTTLEVRLEREPCMEGVNQCRMDIPSWALAGFISNQGWPELPEVLSIVQQPTALLLVNGTTGQHFSTIHMGSALPRGTKMKKASFNHDGTLRIEFAGSMLLIDFRRDQMLLASPEGLHRGKEGASGSPNQTFSKILETTTSTAQTPLYLSAELAVWPNQFARLKWDTNIQSSSSQKTKTNRIPLLQISETEDGLAGVGLNSDGKAEIGLFHADTGEFVLRKSVTLAGGPSQIANTVLSGQTLFQLTSQGYYYHSENGLLPYIRGKDPSRLSILNGGHVFWPKRMPQGCTLVHELQVQQLPRLSKTSALSLPCSIQDSIRTGDAGVVAFERKGTQLKNTVWILQKRPEQENHKKK